MDYKLLPFSSSQVRALLDAARRAGGKTHAAEAGGMRVQMRRERGQILVMLARKDTRPTAPQWWELVEMCGVGLPSPSQRQAGGWYVMQATVEFGS